RALLWMEWRRTGLVLPMGVLLLALLIFGPIGGLAGHGSGTTAQGAIWLALSPILLAIPIGRGVAKQDFWSMELALCPFVTARPVSSSQMVAAKLKTGAISVVIAYAVAAIATTVWVDMGNPANLKGTWDMACTVYSPSSRWVIGILGVGALMIVTWSCL